MAVYLVTGATGFIGRTLCAALSPDVRVRATSRTIGVDGPWHEAVPLDLAAASVPASLLDGVDVVVHLAGVAHRHEVALEDDSVFAAVNVQGTRRLCEAAQLAGVRRLVLASSVAVFADREDGPVREDEAPAPATAYGRSKLAAEQIVRALLEEAVILRFPLVYGPGLPGNLARMVSAIAARRFPPVPATANRRSMIHVEDVGAAIMTAAVSAPSVGRTFTVTDGYAYSTNDVYIWTLAALGRRPPRLTPPAAFFRFLARAGDAFGAVTGRRAPFDGAAYRKLLGSSEYESLVFGRETGFHARWNLQRAMPSIVAALRTNGAH